MPDTAGPDGSTHPHRPRAGRISARAWLWTVTTALAALAAGLVVTLTSEYAAPQARQYLNVSACLLTDAGGVVPGAPGAPVWGAMQSASLATHVMVSYFAATGTSDVPSMLDTLAQRKCGLIITTAGATAQTASTARAYPHQQFLIVAAGAVQPVPPNAALVPPSAAPARIASAIRSLSAQA